MVRRRNEIFQMAMLEPKLTVLDETDSGLDIDALRVVSQGVNAMRSSERSFIVITHYQKDFSIISFQTSFTCFQKGKSLRAEVRS